MHNIALDPGKNYFRTSANEGLFIGMVKMMAGENKLLAEHLKKCQQVSKDKCRNEFTFLSNIFIRNVLSAIRKHMVNYTVNEIKKKGGRFGLLVDGCRDITCEEKISVVVRYISETLNIVERTVGVFNATATSGKELFRSIRETLETIGLKIRNIQGCSFDGASNTRSDVAGVNFYIQQENADCYIHGA